MPPAIRARMVINGHIGNLQERAKRPNAVTSAGRAGGLKIIASGGLGECEDVWLCESPVVGDGHDDRIGEAAGIEGDALVGEDGIVDVEIEWENRTTEGRDGAGDE